MNCDSGNNVILKGVDEGVLTSDNKQYSGAEL